MYTEMGTVPDIQDKTREVSEFDPYAIAAQRSQDRKERPPPAAVIFTDMGRMIVFHETTRETGTRQEEIPQELSEQVDQ